MSLLNSAEIKDTLTFKSLLNSCENEFYTSRARSRSAHCQDRPALPFQEASGPCPDAPRGPKILTPPRPVPERSGAPPRGP